MHYGPQCLALTLLHLWSNFVASRSLWSGGPSQWWVSLTIRCLVALLVLFPPVQGSLMYRLATLSLCKAHPFTRGHAHMLVWLVVQSTCGLVPQSLMVGRYGHQSRCGSLWLLVQCSKCSMLAGVPSWHPGQVPNAQSTVCPAPIALALGPATATSSCCSSCCSP